MEIKNDTIYQIKTKVFLYKNKKYFNIFRNIFINETLNFIYSKNKYHIVSNTKIKEISNKNKDKNSLWNIITKSIKKEKEIIDYDLNNYRINLNEEENEDDYFIQYLKSQTKVIEINNLVYSYLSRICIIKLNKLISISNKDKIPLINLMKIFLGLCSQNFFRINKKIIIKKEGRNPSNNTSKIIQKKQNINEKINNKKEESKIKKIPIIKIKFERKMNDSIKKDISKNQSKLEEENENKKNNSSSAYDEMIYEQIQKSINKLNNKNKNINNKILYSSSLARLFIGETDKDSIREKYLSNFEIKKEKKFKKNQNKNLSSIFFKVFLSRLEQNKNNKLPLIEKGIDNIVTKFKKNQEIIDKFVRLKRKTFNNSYYNGFNIVNKTTIKSEKNNYNIDINRNNKIIERKKNKYGIKIPNKLTKAIMNINKYKDNTIIKMDNNSKTTKYSSLSHNKIQFKEKEKTRLLYDYNYNLKLKNYLELNKIESIKLEKEEKIKLKNNIKKKIFRRHNNINNDIIVLNGNKTTRVKKNINDSFLKYNIFNKQENQLRKNNNVINFLTRSDLFFDSL